MDTSADLLGVEGKLAENIVHFTRALRKAGVKVGTAQLETAIQAVAAAGFSHKADFYYILQSTLISRAENLEVFHQVFSLFWRNPEFLEKMMFQLTPTLPDDRPPEPKSAAHRRAADALNNPADRQEIPQREEITRDAMLTVSQQEVIRQKDFDQMSAAELHEAEQTILTLSLPAPTLAGRRTRPDRIGRLTDPRATLRTALRNGGEMHRIERKSNRPRPPDLIVLCDISGSMTVYSRMIMRFLHALTHARVRQWGQVHAFTFGTRLTNISRALRQSDPDIALTTIGREATDWEGGTMIGMAIKQFNKEWTRRVMSRGAVVLFISDGLERGDTFLLSAEMARLKLISRQLIWLNPLLRWDGFSPQASGIKAILPNVHSFHACHSLDRLMDLSSVLGESNLRDQYLRDITSNVRFDTMAANTHV